MSIENSEFRGLRHECTDEFCHVPDFIRSVEDIDPVSIIRRDVAELREMVDSVMNFIQPLAGEITPVIEKLSKSPMFKMITAGSDD